VEDSASSWLGASGFVEAVGDGREFIKPGDEVYYAGDITRPDPTPKYQLVDERTLAKKTKSLNFAGSRSVAADQRLPLTECSLTSRY